MQDLYAYEKENEYTTYLAGATGALTEMLLGLIGWEPMEQGNLIDSDLFYLGDNREMSIEDAIKKRFRDCWYVQTTMSKKAQERIIDNFSLELKPLDTSFEETITDMVLDIMKDSYREKIGEYKKAIHEYCQEIEECFGYKSIKGIYVSTKKSYTLLTENYYLMFWGAYFVEFNNGYVLMLLPSNSE